MQTIYERFQSACNTVMHGDANHEQTSQIGTLGEKTLHAVAKRYIEPDETKHEVKVGPFYADIATDGAIVEIHTRSFNTLRKKLEAFMEASPVTVVYPLPDTKWLLWIDKQTGEITKKRKSPRHGNLYDSIHELYKIKPLMTHENFHLHIIFMDIEEYRYLDGWSKNKKRGSSRYERIPIAIKEEVFFNTKEDYIQFIPESVPNPFTSNDFKRAVNINMRTAQTALNILHHLNVIRRIGKQGNSHVYERNI